MQVTHPVGDSILTAIESRGLAAVLADYRAARASNPRIDSLPDFGFTVAAEKLIAKGRVADGVAFDEALVETRRAPLMRARLGEAYLKAGKRDRALEAFEAAKVDSLNTGVAEWLRILRPPQ